ncbi:MAG: branched-chain amino acid ABC transporter permease [Nitrospinota bacterium]|nr:MAG: branched-chain amino acid ABC transporter permease [Nitrospinota bacterium]
METLRIIGELLINGLLLGGVYAVMATGLSLIFGVMRILQIAHTALIILGCYFSYALATHFSLDPFLSILLTFPALFLLSMLLYRCLVAPLENAPPVSSLLAFFGVILMVENSIGIIWSTNYTAIYSRYQGKSLALGALILSLPQLLAFCVAVVILTALFLFLKRTEVGRAIRAVSQDRETARILGVDVDRIFLIVFGLAGGLAAVGGALMGIIYSFYPALHWQWLGVVFSVVILGGLGKVQGTVLAAGIIGITESFTSYYLGSQWAPMAAFAILILTLPLRPHGLLGTPGGRL